MIMSDKNRKQGGGIAALVLKLKNGKTEQESPEKEDVEVDSSSALDSAVEDMFSALDTKDKSKFKDALQSFIQICYDELEAEEHEEMEEKEDTNE